MWKNYGLVNAKNLDVDHFTTNSGIKIRKIIHPIMKKIISTKTGMETILVSYPGLNKNTNYIFAAGHSFPGEVATNLSNIDRSVYTLVGTTDQVDHNPEMYFLWLNGMIYVNKLSKYSRKEAYKKMVRILNSKTSLMMFPEGVLNNTENKDCVSLYPGIYHLSMETNIPVVPIVSNYNMEENYALVAAGNPINFNGFNKKNALIMLRDELATLRFNLCRMNLNEARNLNKVLSPQEFLKLNHELVPEVKRDDLKGNLHLKHLENRKKIYDAVKWNDVNCFDEEIMTYKEKGITNIDEVYDFVNKIDFRNNLELVNIIAPLMPLLEEYERYDVKKYMKANFNK